MQTSDRQQVRRVFMEVADLPEVDQEAALARACGEDAALRAEVEALLKAERRAGGFMASPTAEATLVDRSREGPGTRIGPYKLLQQIGEGGFGSVFMAEQQHPVQRKVALKIIKLGMDTKAVIARFEAERQALAMMEHPNIARVLDAGATETGRPYFVMELCKGDPIAEYCDKNNLSVPERLELFAQVCTAVQHAHTKGVIHRDIKPSNILVSTQDGRPHAKVIDFGIAKATASKLTEKTLFTEHRALIGTPEYMSPEQAEGSMDIDTRTDVYSLGVLLYELLTGSTPFSGKDLRSAAFGELQRIIREVDPPKPSTRLSQSADTIAGVAARRQTEPRKLGTIVRGELDWIVMKALEKDRSRRYETASGLGVDIQRYLAGEAVAAAPPSRVYRVRKFVRRHRAAVTAGSLVMAALVMGIVGTTAGLVTANRQRALAVSARMDESTQRALAETRLAESEATVQFLDNMLGAADPLAMGKDVTVRAVMDRAATTVSSQFGDRPVVAARLHATIGQTYLGLGDYRAAETHLREALAIRRRELGADNPDTLMMLSDVGLLLQSQGKWAEAEPYLRETLDKRRRLLGEENLATLDSMNNLGTLLGRMDKQPEAETLLREAVDRSRRTLGDEHRATLRFMGNLGAMYFTQGRLSDAEPLYREVLEKRRRLLGEDHPGTLVALSNMGDLLREEGKLAEAEPYVREALERKRRVFGAEHPNTIKSMGTVGALLRDQGKTAEAEQCYREAIELSRRRQGERHPDTLNFTINLGGVLRAQGKNAEAVALLAGAEADVRAAYPGTEAYRPGLLLMSLGEARAALANDPAGFAVAEANLLEAHRILVQALGDKDQEARGCVRALANLYAAWDKVEPGKDHEVKAAEWRAKLETAK